MSMKSSMGKAAAALSIGVLALTACGEDSGNGEGADGEVTSVALMLNWYPYGEHAPFYYGVQEGIFEEHGIDLEVQAGQGSGATVQAVGTGEIDFGWADTSALLTNVEAEVQARSIGVFLQTTPAAVQFFTDTGIEDPEDLEGREIAVTVGDAVTSTFPTFLENADVDPDAVDEQNLDSAGKVAATISGQTDALIGFGHDQGPKMADEADREVSYFRYADHGLNFFSNGLLAHPDTMEDDSDLVQRMMDATSAAFQAAMEDPEAAAESMQGEDPQIAEHHVVLEQWEETIEILHTESSEGHAPGWNAEEDWENTIDIMLDAGLIEDEHPVEDFFDDSFAPGGE